MKIYNVSRINNKVNTVNFGKKPLLKSQETPNKQQEINLNEMMFISAVFPIKIDNNLKTKNYVPFRGTPEPLSLFPVSNAEDVIRLWSSSQSAKYFDVHDDKIEPENKKIRLQNYSFLDALTKKEDKKIFVKYYCDLTGFPHLNLISEKINNEFSRVKEKSSENLNSKYQTNDFDCIFSGFDKTSSLGIKKAWPSTDLDKGYIVLRGNSYDTHSGSFYSLKPKAHLSDEQIVNAYKEQLWKNTDQRFISLNHNDTFPEVYTIGQIKKQIDLIEPKSKLLLEKNGSEQYVKSRKSREDNLLTNAKFNIDLSNYFPTKSRDGQITKNEVKNFAFFIEALRSDNGQLNYLIDHSDEAIEHKGCPQHELEHEDYLRHTGVSALVNILKNSSFYKLSNVSQIDKWEENTTKGIYKGKIVNRIKLEKEFGSMNVDEQYELIKDIIKSSSEDQSEKFSKYFKNENDIREKYKPLLGILAKGDSSIFDQPEFKKNRYNGVTMQYGENKSVELYNGSDPSILWAEVKSSQDVEEVVANFETLKKIKIFNKVNKIQIPDKKNYAEGFYPINAYTGNHERIYERKMQ